MALRGRFAFFTEVVGFQLWSNMAAACGLSILEVPVWFRSVTRVGSCSAAVASLSWRGCPVLEPICLCLMTQAHLKALWFVFQGSVCVCVKRLLSRTGIVSEWSL